MNSAIRVTQNWPMTRKGKNHSEWVRWIKTLSNWLHTASKCQNEAYLKTVIQSAYHGAKQPVREKTFTAPAKVSSKEDNAENRTPLFQRGSRTAREQDYHSCTSLMKILLAWTHWLPQRKQEKHFSCTLPEEQSIKLHVVCSRKQSNKPKLLILS